jgi:flagellar biosynthesis protein FlhA
MLLDNLKGSYPVVVDELVPTVLNVGDVQKVLQNLLKERISIRNLLLICERLADEGRFVKDVDALTEGVRQSLARAICREYQTPDNTMPVITLDPVIEQTIAETVQRPDKDTYAALDPNTIRLIYASLMREVEKVTALGYQPVVLCSNKVRLYFKRLTERVLPNLVVLSYNEIVPEISVEAIGMITASEERQ